MCKVVRESADLIKAAFPEYREAVVWDPTTREYTGDVIASRPRCDDHFDGYIAYVKAPADLPFEPVDTSEPIAALKVVPHVELTPASKPWLKAVAAATKEYDEQAEGKAAELRAQKAAEDSSEDNAEGEIDDQEDEGQAQEALADWGSVSEGPEEEA